jgi:hypothetical protein
LCVGNILPGHSEKHNLLAIHIYGAVVAELSEFQNGADVTNSQVLQYYYLEILINLSWLNLVLPFSTITSNRTSHTHVDVKLLLGGEVTLDD